MNSIHEDLTINDLDWQDRTFALFALEPSAELRISLQRHGILSPPWIWQKPNGSRVIVDGFKRLFWARREGLKTFECRIFPQDYDPARLMIERAAVKLSGAPLNTAEKSQLIARLTDHLSQQELLRLYLPRLGIPAKPGAIGKWVRLAASPQELLTAAACDDICERAALQLADWEGESQKSMVALLKQLRCSSSIQCEILDRVKEIALRDSIRKEQVLTDPAITDIILDETVNHREKTRLVRARLYRRRYPRVAAREERFVRDMNAAGLPSNVKILPPPSFEGATWQLQLYFQNPQQLMEMLQDLKHSVSSGRFAALIRP